MAFNYLRVPIGTIGGGSLHSSIIGLKRQHRGITMSANLCLRSLTTPFLELGVRAGTTAFL